MDGGDGHRVQPATGRTEERQPMPTTNTPSILSAAALMDLIAVNAPANSAEFIRLTPQNGYFFADTMGEFVQADAKVAFLGLVEILMRQTVDERLNGGTCHKNKFGFSKKHVTRGTELAFKFLTGAELTIEDLVDAVRIAYSYREQLWMVRMGAVPVNHLSLRPIRPVTVPAAE